MSSAITDLDPYPSRGTEPRWLPRREPVVHAPDARRLAGPLRRDQVDAYDRDGYLVLERVFDPSAVTRLAEAADEARARIADDDPAVIREPESDAVRSIFAIHDRLGTLGELCHDRALLEPARQLLGGEVYIHQSRLNYKPGFDGREFWWHSDFETWHVEDGMPAMRALSCSVAISDNLAANGPLLVIPGSHRSFLSCVGTTPADHFRQSLRRQEYGVPDRESLAEVAKANGVVPIVAPAGSVAIFDCNLLHASAGNITPFPRLNAFIVYNSVHNHLVSPFGGLPPRPGFLAQRSDRR